MSNRIVYLRVVSTEIKTYEYGPAPIVVGEMNRVKALGSWSIDDSGNFMTVSMHYELPPGEGPLPSIGDFVKVLMSEDDRTATEIAAANKPYEAHVV